MKTKNIPPDIKSKSINDAKSEILDILERLEKNEANLEGSNFSGSNLNGADLRESNLKNTIFSNR